MKTLVEKWSRPSRHSFTTNRYMADKNLDRSSEVLMRLHDEYEVTVMMGCSGKRFIGNTIENFSQQDLFLIGPHVPHCVQLNEHNREDVITLHFLKEGFGPGFFELPENESIARLLQEAQRGVSFAPSEVPAFHQKIVEITDLQGFERMIAFFQLLQHMSLTPQRTTLSSRGFTLVKNERDYEVVNNIYEYIITRFAHDIITLDEIAAHVSMAPATFCRYFKEHFHKTFTSFLNEVRVGHACKLLQETNMNIAEIAFASGYNHLTHFNRQFKRILGYSPKQYRQQLDRQNA
ncbi:helix-turn-helix domain-containing protein [Persicitalea jodogahamensis]|uniref:AraC family transcriptional regulator n=1 Tax=Persicitalea jodogahamensis TaxID=402147 RepID=A0A8J3D891_9BACT|nr:AraC family transcriptional regulator [Persicitalea jodogahamensis]GHB86831.1 AraC family transcriptional regulator [Persicitalea jodogahamensis]